MENQRQHGRAWSLVRCVVLAQCLVVAGCGGTGGGNDNTAPKGSAALSGRLGVVAQTERTTLLEVEPNDSPGQAQSVGEAGEGRRFEVFGNLSETDSADVFTVTAASPVDVHIVLSFDFTTDDSIDFAIAVLDGRAGRCQLADGGPLYSECFDTGHNPETAEYAAAQSFQVVVRSIRGSGDYVMGLEFSAAELDLEPTPAAVPGEILVRFAPDIAGTLRRHMAACCGLELRSDSPSGWALMSAPSEASAGRRRQAARAAIDALRRTTGVQAAEPNHLYHPAALPNDEHAGLQWHYQLINLPDAWEVSAGSPDVVIGVVDTGVLTGHPDLGGRVIGGFDFISDAGSARDGDGIDPDPSDAGDLTGGPGQSSYHGTHVAGTLGAATGNAFGIAGVTWECGLLVVRALGVGGGTAFDISEAIRYAAGLANVSGQIPDRPASVLNLSIASPAGSPASAAIEDAVADAAARDIVIVAAAGNDASELPSYPAAFGGVIAVAACDPQMRRAPYSNFGSTIDVAAPGGHLAVDLTGDGFGDGVLSLGGVDQPSGIDFTISFQHGTSMAAPHAAGVAALMRSINPDLSAADVREILTGTARPSGEPGEFGAGVIDAARAVNEAAVRRGVIVTSPRLGLSTTSLDFGSTVETLTVQISNTGAGSLVVGSPQVVELGGGGWLSAGLIPASGSSNASAVVLTVQRAGLADGRHFGRVRVPAEGLEPGDIEVSMTVGGGSPIEDLLFVVVVDAQTRGSVAQDTTHAGRAFQYAIEGLAPGRYQVYAGTDRDDDGLICDLGELCGGHPSAIEAAELVVEDGQQVTDLDFAVGALVFSTQTSTMKRPPPVQRLR